MKYFSHKSKCLGDKSYFVTQCIILLWQNMLCHPIYLKSMSEKKNSSQKESDFVRKVVSSLNLIIWVRRCISSPKSFETNKWRNIFLTKCKCSCEESYFVVQCIYFVWENMFCHPIYLKSISEKKIHHQRKVISSPN